VEGYVRNEGFIFNYGTIFLTGNWENLTSYNEGTGRLHLVGTSTQVINHNGQLIYALEVSGAGEKKLIGNLTVTGELLLNEGILTPAAGSILLVEEKATVHGGSASSHINGPLFLVGTGYKFFPVGKHGDYAPVILEDITGASLVTGFEVFESNTYALTSSLRAISPARYWLRTQLAGTILQGLISLPFNAADKLTSLENVVVAQAGEDGSPFESLGQSSLSGDLLDGRVTSKDLITGKQFAVGTSQAVTGKGLFFIPNAFSPASFNPEEQVVKLYGETLSGSGFVFRVFDRWGNQVFENNSLQDMATRGWPGIHAVSGQVLQAGVYTYLLQAHTKDGQGFRKSGTITLIR
jgi:hypothetical protein